MPQIRDVEQLDIPRLYALNHAAVPAVNDVSEGFLAGFLESAMYYRVVCVDDVVAGFLLVLGPGHDYPSLNYQFFAARHDMFAYVDRIVVGAEARGRGLARAFYEDLARTVRGQVPLIVCEVNTRPPNPVSLAFHKRMGFVEVGHQETENGKKEVVLLEKRLLSGSFKST